MSTGKDVQKGVAEAFDFWLSQHDVTVPDAVEMGVRDAVERWLDAHGEAVLTAAVERALDRERDANPLKETA